MAVTEQQVQDALKGLTDPNTRKDYVTTKSARNIKVDGDRVSVDILLGYPAKSQLAPVREEVTRALKAIPGVSAASVNVQMKIVSHAVQRGVKLVGVDYLSVAPFEDLVETHNILLKAGVVIVEGLDLSQVGPGRYNFYCLPLKIAGADGAPARALLMGVCPPRSSF